MSHIQKHVSAKRMYVEPRRGSFDADLGPYCADDRDPRWSGDSMCCDCMGTKYGPTGEKCEYCNGVGTIPEDMA